MLSLDCVSEKSKTYEMSKVYEIEYRQIQKIYFIYLSKFVFTQVLSSFNLYLLKVVGHQLTN